MNSLNFQNNMEQLLKLMEDFEKRNNISISIDLCDDGSGMLKEYWEEDVIKTFDNSKELELFLSNGKLEMNKGRAVKPIKILD